MGATTSWISMAKNDVGSAGTPLASDGQGGCKRLLHQSPMQTIGHGIWADNVLPTGKSKKEVRDMLQSMTPGLVKWGLRWTWSSLQWWRVNPCADSTLTADDMEAGDDARTRTAPHVETTHLLGVMLATSTSNAAAWKRRVSLASAAHWEDAGLYHCRSVRLMLKWRHYRSKAQSRLLHGCRV